RLDVALYDPCNTTRAGDRTTRPRGPPRRGDHRSAGVVTERGSGERAVHRSSPGVASRSPGATPCNAAFARAEDARAGWSTVSDRARRSRLISHARGPPLVGRRCARGGAPESEEIGLQQLLRSAAELLLS